MNAKAMLLHTKMSTSGTVFIWRLYITLQIITKTSDKIYKTQNTGHTNVKEYYNHIWLLENLCVIQIKSTKEFLSHYEGFCGLELTE